MTKQETYQRMFDRTHTPSETNIINFINDAKVISVWYQLTEYLKHHYGVLSEIIYYGEKYGWVTRYRKSGRTIISLFPEKNSFSLLIIFGKKEIEKFLVQKPNFSPDIVNIFQNTKTLHDGKWLWLRVTDSKLLEDVKKLIAIKRRPKKLD